MPWPMVLDQLNLIIQDEKFKLYGCHALLKHQFVVTVT